MNIFTSIDSYTILVLHVVLLIVIWTIYRFYKKKYSYKLLMGSSITELSII